MAQQARFAFCDDNGQRARSTLHVPKPLCDNYSTAVSWRQVRLGGEVHILK